MNTASNSMVTVSVRCPFCGKEYSVTITQDQLNRFNEGGVMNVLDLDANTREALKTGICPKCWDSM